MHLQRRARLAWHRRGMQQRVRECAGGMKVGRVGAQVPSREDPQGAQQGLEHRGEAGRPASAGTGGGAGWVEARLGVGGGRRRGVKGVNRALGGGRRAVLRQRAVQQQRQQRVQQRSHLLRELKSLLTCMYVYVQMKVEDRFGRSD